MESEMNKGQVVSDNLPKVFIHSSFRTGSTWLWSKFRENSGCYCYYEIFNEILGTINFRNILQSSADWNSHHPRGAPYFSEFSPLLDKAEGIAGFDQDMALTDFFLNSKGDIDRVRQTEAYLASLIKLAEHNKRIPVLSCTRSIGRTKLIRESIGGTHILIRRRLLNQWFSYSNQKLNNNSFFFNTIIRTVNAQEADEFIVILSSVLKDNEITQDSFGQCEDNILIVFLCLHIYLYAKHQNDFDIVIDFHKGSSRSDLDAATRLIAEKTQIHVDLSDYSETISAPGHLIQDVDRVFSMVRSLFAKPILGIDDAKLRTLVDDEIADFKRGYDEYCRIAGSAHAQLKAYAIERSQLENACMNATNELAAVHRSEKQQADELRTQLEAATIDLEIVNGQLKETKLAMQQEHAAFGDRASQMTDRIRDLEAKLESGTTERDMLQRDLQKISEREAKLNARLEEMAADVANLSNQLRQAELGPGTDSEGG